MSAISIDAAWECAAGALVSSARATFNPSRSWWRNAQGGVWGGVAERASSSQAQEGARRNSMQRDMQLLEHEQLHFDIAEVGAREDRGALCGFQDRVR